MRRNAWLRMLGKDLVSNVLVGKNINGEGNGMLSNWKIVLLWRILECDVLQKLEFDCKKAVEDEMRKRSDTGTDSLNKLKLDTLKRFDEMVYKPLVGDDESLRVALEVITSRQSAERLLAKGLKQRGEVWRRLNVKRLDQYGMTKGEILFFNGQIEQDYYRYRESWLMDVVLTELKETMETRMRH